MKGVQLHMEFIRSQNSQGGSVPPSSIPPLMHRLTLPQDWQSRNHVTVEETHYDETKDQIAKLALRDKV